MAKNKKGFILYADQQETFKELTDEQAGKLIKHIFAYVNDEDPVTDDPLLKLAFIPIKQSLKRDLEHWESVRKKRSEAGKASAEKRKQVSTSVESVQQKSTKPTVRVIDTVKVIVKDIKEDREELLFSWLKYRKEIKKPINNESTLIALVKKLNSHTLADVNKSITQSIENSWQGLRWEHVKEDDNSPYPLKKGSREYNVELQVGLIDVNGYPTKK